MYFLNTQVPFTRRVSPTLTFSLRCFQLHVLFQCSYQTSWLPAQKRSNFNLEDILNPKDMNAILSQLQPCRLQTCHRFAERALWLFRFYWGAAATAQRSGDTAKVGVNFTFSVFPIARGSQAIRPSGGCVKMTPFRGLDHSASRWHKESLRIQDLRVGTRLALRGLFMFVLSGESFLSSVPLPLFFAHNKLFVWAESSGAPKTVFQGGLEPTGWYQFSA